MELFWGWKKKEEKKELKTHTLFPIGNIIFSLSCPQRDWIFLEEHLVRDTNFDIEKDIKIWEWSSMTMAQSHEMVKTTTFILFLPCSYLTAKFMQNFRKGREELEIRLSFKDGKWCNNFHVGRKDRNAVYSLTNCE